MKTIKRIALKDAKILTNEEMKLLFGGSAMTEQQLINKTCKVNESCSVVFLGPSGSGNVTRTGTCQGSATTGSVSCYCEVNGHPTSSTHLSHCFRGN